MIASMTITPSGGTPLQVHGADNGYVLQPPIDGLEDSGRRIDEYNKPGEDGGAIPQAFYGIRPVTLPGMVFATTEADHETRRTALREACQTVKDSNGRPLLTTFDFTTTNGKTYRFTGQVKSIKNPIVDMTHSKFLVSVSVTNPFLTAQTQTNATGITTPVGGGFVLPVILPIVFAASSGGQKTVTNNGDAIAWPVLTIDGQATNPYILNNTIGKAFQLNLTTTPSDSLVIDMKERTVTLNGTSVMYAKNVISEWWWLNPSGNDIRFSTGSTADTGQLSVGFRDSFLGA